MKHSLEKQEAQTPQRPDLGIMEVRGPCSEITLSRDDFPWLSDPESNLPLTEMSLVDTNRVIRYGSAVSGNKTLAKLASRVTQQSSINAERSMFKALPAIFENQTAPNVNSVTTAQGTANIFKTTKIGNNVPRIFFTILESASDKPIVVKIGVATHAKQQQVYGILTGSDLRRKKRD